MRIAFLGLGTWGFALAHLLASKGYNVTSWTTKPQLAEHINSKREHPNLQGFMAPPTLSATTDMQEALSKAEIIIEAVTSAGVRPVFRQVKELKPPHCPIIMTSKGIEQDSGLILPDVVIEILGEEARNKVGILSGPSFAQEVIRGLPVSVVGAAYDFDAMMQVCEAFTTSTFRVYPNSDVQGVAYGGALKNIIAIACGVAEGLSLGYSCAAALMTRGLHEIRKLAIARGCKGETLNGLSGMGDICLTCTAPISRNFRYGYLLAQGLTPEAALKEIGMVVEGTYTCVSALQLSKQLQVAMPITEMVYKIVYLSMPPQYAVDLLMQRSVKQEHL
ncbi:MAG: NAD(P)H-dependent glycerol-3-phosphate dehydrogenase [Parachlamydiales bacterium]|jgi:glycerol-3-phosphate dehydrogenase (NAD(P)+)